MESDNKINANELNENLKDMRVGSQYIPISKINENNSTAYSFIDRNSITLHPYNKKIRIFTKIINWKPALTQEKDDKTNLSIRSLVIQQLANCDKMELAKGKIQWFEKYFGEGNLINTDDSLNRWIAISKNNEQRQLLVVACSLPLVGRQQQTAN